MQAERERQKRIAWEAEIKEQMRLRKLEEQRRQAKKDFGGGPGVGGADGSGTGGIDAMGGRGGGIAPGVTGGDAVSAGIQGLAAIAGLSDMGIADAIGHGIDMGNVGPGIPGDDPTSGGGGSAGGGSGGNGGGDGSGGDGPGGGAGTGGGR